MKKLYNGKVKKIHPSLSSPSPWDFLASLPAAVLTLAAALSPEEKEVLVYLLSGGDTGFASDRAFGKTKSDRPPEIHPPELGCRCFECYKSFWARWNASPNNHLIHHILDAVEESLAPRSLPSPRRRTRRSRRKDSAGAAAERKTDLHDDEDDDLRDEEDDDFARSGEVSGREHRISMGRLVSFIGTRVWGVWNY